MERNNKKTDRESKIDERIVAGKEQGMLSTIVLFFLELIKLAIVAGITIGVVRYFLFKPFYVKGQSMEPNFYEKDYLIIDEITYRFRGPQRGEVVVFNSPVGNKDYYLKRIVGLPGELVKIETNKVIIYSQDHPEGVIVDEIYTNEETYGSLTERLGPDEYFVMGDNRDESFDSRRFGPINKKDIVGRACFRGWPFSRVSILQAPYYDL